MDAPLICEPTTTKDSSTLSWAKNRAEKVKIEKKDNPFNN